MKAHAYITDMKGTEDRRYVFASPEMFVWLIICLDRTYGYDGGKHDCYYKDYSYDYDEGYDEYSTSTARKFRNHCCLYSSIHQHRSKPERRTRARPQSRPQPTPTPPALPLAAQ